MSPPPTEPTTLRAEREQTLSVLCEAFASDAIDGDEFERRVDLVHRALQLDELERLRADLSGIRVPEPTAALVPVRAAAAPIRKRQRLVAVLGGAMRRGPWTPAREIRATAVLGGIELDFRDAVFPPRVTDLHVVAVLGGVQITVPPNLPVEMEGIGILGGFDHLARSPGVAEPDAPLLRVHGTAVLGGVTVRTRLPGEREEALRERRGRHRRALPPGR
jgi:hypothetical protein